MLQAGFEFEFGHDVELDEIKDIIKSNFPEYKIFTTNPNSGTYRKLYTKYFNFKWDASVDVRRCKYNQREVSTPVFIGRKEIPNNQKLLLNPLEELN